MRAVVSVAELADDLGSPDLRVCDVRWHLADPDRGRVEYQEGHVPGAVFVDLETVLTGQDGPGRHPLPDPTDFARRLAASGIGRGHRVVAYDDAGGSIAARLWWMLGAIGHGEVAVLDGGYPAWLEAGLPVETEPPALPPAVPLPAPEHWPGTVDRKQVASLAGRVPVVDVRAPERYRGDAEPVDPIAGHIPGAVNLPFSILLDGGRLRPVQELRALLEGVGAGDGAFVAHCGSGVNACHLLLAADLAGVEGGLLYEGSWSDWSRHPGSPVATGDDPGEPTGE